MALLRARQSFATADRSVSAGTLVDSSDPIVSGREDLFEPAAAAVAVVEQATAAPGSKRRTSKS